jgi:predicted membrane channel-forming protein YqfA (hemolysin III family)
MCFMDKGSVMVDQIWLYGVGGAIYIFGAYLYAVRLPEKNHPGKFDICGSSH